MESIVSGHKTLGKLTQSLLYIETKGNSDKSAKEWVSFGHI